MISKLLYIAIFLFSFSLVAQVEGPKKSIPIPAVETKEDKKEPTPTPIKITPKEENKKDNTNLGIKNPMTVNKKETEFSMIDNSTLMDPGQIFEKKWNSKAIEQGFKPETMEDVFFGDYKITGEHANIVCRDHEFPDGDRVRVFVNDEIFILDLTLTGNYKSFKVPLVQGINKIVFHALNQGESGPNTAEFQVYDDNEVQVSSKKWNLLTGVNATIIVVKE